jgi:hypothetical protein
MPVKLSLVGPVLADDELVLNMDLPAHTQYSTNDYGCTELHLQYGLKEISFDEPGLFSFGEALALQSRFIAMTAVTWGTGYEWPRVQGLLEQLIEEGVFQRIQKS